MQVESFPENHQATSKINKTTIINPTPNTNNTITTSQTQINKIHHHKKTHNSHSNSPN